jgi:hypothetical protein
MPTVGLQAPALLFPQLTPELYPQLSTPSVQWKATSRFLAVEAQTRVSHHPRVCLLLGEQYLFSVPIMSGRYPSNARHAFYKPGSLTIRGIIQGLPYSALGEFANPTTSLTNSRERASTALLDVAQPNRPNGDLGRTDLLALVLGNDDHLGRLHTRRRSDPRRGRSDSDLWRGSTSRIGCNCDVGWARQNGR